MPGVMISGGMNIILPCDDRTGLPREDARGSDLRGLIERAQQSERNLEIVGERGVGGDPYAGLPAALAEAYRARDAEENGESGRGANIAPPVRFTEEERLRNLARVQQAAREMEESRATGATVDARLAAQSEAVAANGSSVFAAMPERKKRRRRRGKRKGGGGSRENAERGAESGNKGNNKNISFSHLTIDSRQGCEDYLP